MEILGVFVPMWAIVAVACVAVVILVARAVGKLDKYDDHPAIPRNREPVIPASKVLTYAELLRQPEWKEFRQNALSYYGHACLCCGKHTRSLNVHHTYYMKDDEGNLVKPWEYPLTAVTVLCTGCHHEWHHRFKPPVFLRAHVVNRAGKLYVLLDAVNRVVWIISDIVDNMALWDEFTAYTKTQESRLNWGTMASICIMDAKWVGGRWIITDPLLAGYEHPGYGHDGYVARDIMDFGPKYANDKILVAEVISIIHEFERIYGMGLMGQRRRA